MMKNTISIILFVVLLFSLAGCGTEDKTQNATTTTQVSTTVIETTTKAGISKEKAIEIAKDEVWSIIEDELWDEYDLIADTSEYEFSFSSATYDEANQQWKVELLGQCLAKDFNTRRYLGYYAFEVKVYVTTKGLVDGSVVTGIGRM